MGLDAPLLTELDQPEPCDLASPRPRVHDQDRVLGPGCGVDGVGLRGRGPVGLEVVGRARFSGVGGGTIADRADSARVDDPAITAASHVTVALNGDPGGQVQVAWVALRPGRGFTLHLTDRARSATPFTYMVVEPVG